MIKKDKGENMGEYTQIKVAFYMDNTNMVDRNFLDVEMGNPGIGGSHYMQLLMSYYLVQRYSDLKIIMYTTRRQDLPAGIEGIQVKDMDDALARMKQDGCKVFVLSNWCSDLGVGIHKLRLIDKYKIKTIIWAHIFMNYKQYHFISSSKYIRLFVCLGKQQLEMLRGLQLYKKATYINYMLPPVHTSRIMHEKKVVVYVGAMYPYKGFHILAKHWKYIKNKIEDAQLWVIGSAKLYGNNILLGKYGIAEPKYEKQFMPYLLDADGNIDKGIKFFGDLGWKEKEEIVSQATVGVFNPSGISETFGL